MISRLSLASRVRVVRATSFVSSIRQLSYRSEIDSSALTVQVSQNLKDKLPIEELQFGRSFTDHMLEIDWDATTGWHAPRIIPYQNLSLSPASSVLHYGIECFEGMKAYKGKDGEIRLFRPDRNIERLNNSMSRLGMPAMNLGNGFLDCLKKLLTLDHTWIPQKDGYSMYIRPTAIGTSPFLGVQVSEQIKLYVILSPVGPYYKSGFKPIKLLADTKNVRAWPGGVGNVKVGGNYGPTIKPSLNAGKEGYAQILWLFGEQHQITEVGAMNIFFVIRNKKTNVVELITAPLDRGDILPGVTRDSIINIAAGWKDVSVHERWLTMPEVAEAAKEGRLLETFGAGTGVVVSPVKAIKYNGEDINIPTGEEAGPITMRLWNSLLDIQYGRVEHPWSVKV